MARSPPRPRGFMVHIILTTCLFVLAAYQTVQLQSERQTLQLRDRAIATQDGVISESKEKIQMLAEQMKDRGASLNEVGKQRDLLVEELASVQKQLQEAISSNAELEESKSELQEAKSSFEDQVRDKEAEIEGLKEALKLERSASKKGLSERESLEKIRLELQEEKTRLLAEVEKFKSEGTSLASPPPAPTQESHPASTPPSNTEAIMSEAKLEVRGSEDSPTAHGTIDDRSQEARSVAEITERAAVKKEGEEETLLARKKEDETEGAEGGEGDEEEDEEDEKDERYKGEHVGKSVKSKLNGGLGDPEDRDEEGEVVGKEDEMEEEVEEAKAKEEGERSKVRGVEGGKEHGALKEVGEDDEVGPKGTPGLEAVADRHVWNPNAVQEGEFVNTKAMGDAWEAGRRERNRARKEERRRAALMRAKMRRAEGVTAKDVVPLRFERTVEG